MKRWRLLYYKNSFPCRCVDSVKNLMGQRRLNTPRLSCNRYSTTEFSAIKWSCCFTCKAHHHVAAACFVVLRPVSHDLHVQLDFACIAASGGGGGGGVGGRVTRAVVAAAARQSHMLPKQGFKGRPLKRQLVKSLELVALVQNKTGHSTPVSPYRDIMMHWLEHAAGLLHPHVCTAGDQNLRKMS
eukprot:6201207-Amphidinium_carterae.1